MQARRRGSEKNTGQYSRKPVTSTSRSVSQSKQLDSILIVLKYTYNEVRERISTVRGLSPPCSVAFSISPVIQRSVFRLAFFSVLRNSPVSLKQVCENTAKCLSLRFSCQYVSVKAKQTSSVKWTFSVKWMQGKVSSQLSEKRESAVSAASSHFRP